MYRDQHGNPVPEHPLAGLLVSPHQFSDWVPDSSGGMSARTSPSDFAQDSDWYSAAINPSDSGTFTVSVRHGERGDLVAQIDANRLGLAKMAAQAAVGRHARGADMETGRILRQGTHRPDTFAERGEIRRLTPVLREVVSHNRYSTGNKAPTEQELKGLTEGIKSAQGRIGRMNEKIDSTTRSNMINSGTGRVDIEDWADPSPNSVVLPPRPERPAVSSRREEREAKSDIRFRKNLLKEGLMSGGGLIGVDLEDWGT